MGRGEGYLRREVRGPVCLAVLEPELALWKAKGIMHICVCRRSPLDRYSPCVFCVMDIMLHEGGVISSPFTQSGNGSSSMV